MFTLTGYLKHELLVANIQDCIAALVNGALFVLDYVAKRANVAKHV